MSKVDLHTYFQQLEDPSVVYYNHDMSHPPTGRLHNKRFVETSDGEFALIADVDVFDEDLYAKSGGFSISFSGRRGESKTPDTSPDLTVQYDLRVFEYEKEIRPILLASCEALSIATRELKRKTAGEVAILVLAFASTAGASGFFGEGGADVYRALKERLKDLGRSVQNRRGTTTSIQVFFPMRFKRRDFKVIVDIPVEQLEIADRAELDVDSVKRYIRHEIGDSVIRQIALEVLAEPPYLKIRYFIDSDGEIVTLP